MDGGDGGVLRLSNHVWDRDISGRSRPRGHHEADRGTEDDVDAVHRILANDSTGRDGGAGGLGNGANGQSGSLDGGDGGILG